MIAKRCGGTWISDGFFPFVPFLSDECYDGNMLSGFNHNLRHGGILFHIQTEDGGVGNPTVVTQVFVGGNILASRRSNYSKFVSKPTVREIVSAMMQEQHKQMMKDLVHGRLSGVQKLMEEPRRPLADPEHVPPGRTLDTTGAEKKTLDELILEFLTAENDPKR